MTATQPVKRKAKREIHAYFEVRRMIDPATGEEVGCLVPRSQSDRRMLRDKAIKTGDVVRLPVRKPRNEKYNRLAHALGRLVVEQIDGFQNENAHSALKRMQADSGVMCESVVYAIPGVGNLTRTEPRSLAFDEMDEADFRLFMQGICRHIVERYWPTTDPDTIEAMLPMMPEQV